MPDAVGGWLPGEGKCDLAGSGISDLPERRTATGQRGIWSSSFYSVVRAFAVRQDAALAGLEDLAGQPVIVTKGESQGLAEALNAYIGQGQGGAWDYQGNVEKREHGGDPVDCRPAAQAPAVGGGGQ